MKVIHFDSGLGNQMLSYCEYLSMQKANPSDQFYIENIIYEIPQCNQVTCQWNGYELDRIFGIDLTNIRSLISDADWKLLMTEITESEFWNKNMNFPVYFTRAFEHIGIHLVNTWGNYEEHQFMGETLEKRNKNKLKYRIKKTLPWLYLRMWKNRRPIDISRLNYEAELFPTSTENLYAGQKLYFKYKGSGIERIEKEIRHAFHFPKITDMKNSQAMQCIRQSESVAIHARRGDMLGQNYACYVTGYFKRSVKYIRQHTSNPVFFIFCDPDSVQWAKENANILGLDFMKDDIVFVDWNSGTDSYRDMQLMAQCKHQVITNSSFGWWGAWLNTNPEKITCSPDFIINTTHTF